jgi:hypothetical protein
LPHVLPSSITVNIASGTNYTTSALVTVLAPGLPRLGKGNGAAVRAFSHIAELDSNSGTPPPSGISYAVASSTLIDYVNPSTNTLNSAHQAVLASAINTFCIYNADGSSSHAVNSNSPPCWEGFMSFDDVCTHDGVYDLLVAPRESGSSNPSYFPTPVPGNPSSSAPYNAAVANYKSGHYSTTKNGTAEYQIAQWDAGTAPSSTGSCPAPAPYYVPPDIPQP